MGISAKVASLRPAGALASSQRTIQYVFNDCQPAIHNLIDFCRIPYGCCRAITAEIFGVIFIHFPMMKLIDKGKAIEHLFENGSSSQVGLQGRKLDAKAVLGLCVEHNDGEP